MNIGRIPFARRIQQTSRQTRSLFVNELGENQMIYENQEYKYPTNTALNILVGMLIGSIAGAVAMLLLAPQSGKDTRTQIQKRGIELRDRTTGMVEDTLAQVRLNPNKVEMSVKNYEQLEHISDAA
jgi:gas vesicle protein